MGKQWVPAIYTHTTLTNDIKHTNYPIDPGRERSALSDANLTALLTDTDGTDLPDSETAELNDIDSYLSSITQMDASNVSDIWRIPYEQDEPDDTYLCSSRPNRRLRCESDLTTFQDITPYSEIYKQ